MQYHSVATTIFLLSLAPFVLCAPPKSTDAKVMNKLWNEQNSNDQAQIGKRAIEDGDKFWKRGEELDGFWKRGDSNPELSDLVMNLRDYLAQRAEASKRGYQQSSLQKAQRRRQEALMGPEFNPTGW